MTSERLLTMSRNLIISNSFCLNSLNLSYILTMDYHYQSKVYHDGTTFGLGRIIPGSDMREILARPYLAGDSGPLARVGREAGAYHLWVGPGQRGDSLYCLGSGPYGYQVWKYSPRARESWISDQDSKNQQISLYVRQLILRLVKLR